MADVIGVVGADVCDIGIPILQLGVVRGFDGFSPGGQNLIQLLDRGGPILAVKIVEGLVIVSAEFLGGLAVEFGEFLAVPENQMIS